VWFNIYIFICVTWLIHVCCVWDKTRSRVLHVWHDSFMRVILAPVDVYTSTFAREYCIHIFLHKGCFVYLQVIHIDRRQNIVCTSSYIWAVLCIYRSILHIYRSLSRCCLITESRQRSGELCSDFLSILSYLSCHTLLYICIYLCVYMYIYDIYICIYILVYI